MSFHALYRKFQRLEAKGLKNARESVLRDIRWGLNNLQKKDGEDIYRVVGKICKYILQLLPDRILVVTILYKKELKGTKKDGIWHPIGGKEAKKIMNKIYQKTL